MNTMIQADSTPKKQKPQLLAMNLINSFCGSNHSNLGIAGGASLGGENGAGKSSFLIASLFFFGCEPSQIKSASNRPPLPHYFPAANSWMVFEYRRHTGDHAQVAIFRNERNDGINYLLIAGEYDQNHYVNPDTHQARGVNELLQHLQQTGIHHSQRIAIIENYRAIVFGLESGHAKLMDATIARQRASFSMAQDGRGMTRLHRVSAALLGSNKADFLPVRQIIADEIAEHAGSIEQLRIPQLTADLQGIYNLYSHLQAVGDAGLLRAKLLEASGRLRGTRENMHSMRAAARQRQKAAIEDAEKLSQVMKESQAVYEADIQRLLAAESEVTNARNDQKQVIAEHENLIAKFDAEEDRLNRSPRHASVEDAARKGELHADKAHWVSQRTSIQAGSADRQEILQKAAEHRDQICEEARLKAASIIAGLEETLAAQEAHCDEERLIADRTHRSACEDIAMRRDAADDRCSNLRAQIDQGITQAQAENQAEALRKKAQEEEKLLVEHRKRIEILQSQQAAQQRGMDRAQTDLEDLVRRLQNAEKALRAAQDMANPNASSVHGWLNQERVGWQNALGKILHPSILAKSASIIQEVDGHQSAVMGLEFDLESLTTPANIDPELLMQRCEEAASQIAALERECESKEREIGALKSGLNITTRKIAEALVDRERSEDRARSHRIAAEQHAERAQEKVRALDQERRSAEQEQQRCHEALKVELKEADRRHVKQRQDQDAQISNLRIQFKADKAIAEGDRNDTITQAKMAYLSTVEAQQRSRSDQLRQLDEKITGIEAILKAIELDARLDEDWARHRARTADIDALRMALPNLNANVAQLGDRIRSLKLEQHLLTSANTMRQQEHDKLRRAQNHERTLMAHIIDLLKTEPGEETAKEEHLTASADALFEQARTVQEARSGAITACQSLLGQLRRVFLGRIDQDDLVTQWYKSNIHCGPDERDELTIEAAVNAYGAFYSVELESMRTQNASDIRIPVELLQNLWEKLKGVETKIADLARDWNAHASALTLPPKLRNLRIHLGIDHNKLSCMGLLRDFVARIKDASSEEVFQQIIRLQKRDEWQRSLSIPVADWIKLEFEVTEMRADGWHNNRFFSKASLADNSSNGLNTICLILVYVMVLKVATNGQIIMPMVLDESDAIDDKNSHMLYHTLKENSIDLITAAPRVDSMAATLVSNPYRVGSRFNPLKNVNEPRLIRSDFTLGPMDLTLVHLPAGD